MDPRHGSGARACYAACSIAILSCLLVACASAPLLGSTLGPPPPPAAATSAAAGEAAAGAAECSLHISGGEGRIIQAGMKCTGPEPTIALAPSHMGSYMKNFTGVAISNNSCNEMADTSVCLVTICAGTVMLWNSSVRWVRGIPSLTSLVSVGGDSRVEVHRSGFSMNHYTPLVVMDQAHLLLNGSIVANNSVEGPGGGLYIDGHANVTITGQSRVEGNNATDLDASDSDSNSDGPSVGGGLAVYGNATVTLTGGSSVLSNIAGFGGGLGVYGSANVTITGGSSVQGNTAEVGDGGGFYVRDIAIVTLTGSSSVQGNTAKDDGGGLMVLDDATVTLTDGSTVKGNKARWGGGMAVWDNATVTLSGGSVVHHNIATDFSCGGLDLKGSANVTLTGGSSVKGNTAKMKGGGLCVSQNATVTLAGGSTVEGNTAGSDGGGLFMVRYAIVTLTGGSKILDNTAGGSGGGLSVGDFPWRGKWGLIHYDGHSVVVTLSGSSSVQNNTAERFGGGLLITDSSNATFSGGSSVQGNTAGTSGGGLAVATGANVMVTGGSSVHSNMAVNGTGGGLDVSRGARVTVSKQSTIFNNTCSGGVGGGIAVSLWFETTKFDASGRVADADTDRGWGAADLGFGQSYVTISNSTIFNNTSIGAAGGGLAVGPNSIIKLVDGTVVSRNLAVNSSGGGVLLIGTGTLHADSSVVFANNAVKRGYVGSTIAAFDNSTLVLPLRGGNLTACTAGVYLGLSSCQHGEMMQHDVCVCCQPHTFSFSDGSCEPCPSNGKCIGGSLVQPLPGYWSSAPTSVQMHHCPLSTTACNYTDPDHQCNEGYTGPLCGACQLPRFGTMSPFECGRCMDSRLQQLGVYLSMSCGSVVFVTYTVHATWRDNLTGDKVVLATDMIKVLVQFLQYTAIIGSVSVPWPLFNMKRCFQAVNIPFAGSTGQTLSLDCWLVGIKSRLPLAMQRQLVYFLAPVCVLLAVLALLWLFWVLGRWVVPLVRRPKEGSTPQPAMSVVRKMPVTLMVVAFYSYPTLVRAALSLFACLRIDRVPPEVELPQGATALLNHTAGYWVSDITQQCFAGFHMGWALGLGIPSVLLWCIAVPVTMGVGLFLCRAKADEDSFREHFGFLYRSYKPERMWWEAVWAARTVVLTLISVFAIPMGRYFAVLSLLVVFLASAVLQNVFQPYAFATLHHMHTLSTSCLAVTTLGALAMLAYDIQESTAKNLRIAIAVLVLVVNVVFVGWCVWKLMPAVKGWCVTAYSMVKSGVLWVVEVALNFAGHPKAGRGRGRGRRGSAGCCV